jgi:hypothetical protein
MVWLAAGAMILSTVAFASPKVAVLDGTSWKVDVEPDSMAKDKGEKQFKETLTFADGNITLSAPKVGSEASPYSVSKAGEKDTWFSGSLSAGEATGLDGERSTKKKSGQMILTKNDGAVFTYNHGSKPTDSA